MIPGMPDMGTRTTSAFLPRPWTWQRVGPAPVHGCSVARPDARGHGLVAADGQVLLRVDSGWGTPEVWDPDAGSWRLTPIDRVAEAIASGV
jgi:hypothetical protein